MANGIGTVLTTSLALVQNFPQAEEVDQHLKRVYSATDKVLGKGGFGTVVEGKHLFSGSPLAIKKQRNSVDAQTEACTLHCLQGIPHLVRYRAAFLGSPKQNPRERVHHIVMDKVPGKHIVDAFLLAKKPADKLVFNEIVTCARQLLEFLDALHKRGLIYFDLKPDNLIFMRDSRQLTVVDCGGVRDARNTSHGLITTRNYRAPELLLGKTLSADYDLWSFGCTLYALLTEKCLFSVAKDIPEERKDNYMLQMIDHRLDTPPTLEYLSSSPTAPQIFNTNREFRQKEQLPRLKKWQEVVRETGRKKRWPSKEVEMFIGIIDSVIRYENRASPKELLASPLFKNEISAHLQFEPNPKCKIYLLRASKVTKPLESLTPSDLAAADIKIDLYQSHAACLHIPRDTTYVVVLEKDGTLVADRIILNDHDILNVSQMQEVLAKQTIKAKRNLFEDIEADPILKKSRKDPSTDAIEPTPVEVSISTEVWMKTVLQ